MSYSCNVAGEALMEKTLSLVRFNEPPFQALQCLDENEQGLLDNKINDQPSVPSMSSDHYKRRRERNVVSSRLYRKRKRQRMEGLEKENQRLQGHIMQTEIELASLKRTFQHFVQHAETCSQCSTTTLSRNYFSERNF